MEPTIIEDNIFEFESFEEDGSALMAAETSWRGMADELQELHYLKGARFINQLKLIIYYGEFHLDYNARLLASDIKTYFESNRDAIEVLIFKGKKAITIKRGLACNLGFNRIFRRLYEK